jgi:hypothetical protein
MVALFFVAVFPGNIAQYTEHRAAFGLNTDTARLVRLFFQPLQIARFHHVVIKERDPANAFRDLYKGRIRLWFSVSIHRVRLVLRP